MAFIVKPLAVGNIGMSTGTLYTVPAGKSAIISSVRLTNNSAANSALVNLLVSPSGGSDVRITRKDYSLAVGGATMVMEDEVTLGPGEALRWLVTQTSPAVHYLVNGVERS
jgi:hypothetical protein